MNDEGTAIDRETAQVYAQWFQALADSTRILILNLLACNAAAMSVGAIATTLELGQSTVSHHLKILYEVGFVTRTRRGTSSLYEVNGNCLTKFPNAAEVVMGLLPRYSRPRVSAPWLDRSESGRSA
jgi:DNA-binding transcriptional ArsR family regulator